MKIGTDFSGIGSPEMALKLLDIEHEQVFACEIDKYARKSFEAIHGNPQRFYEDITKRDHSEIPQLDLYVAGFPCQAFSMAGKRKGFDDVRGTLFFNVAEFIKINQPKCFILENVKGLLSHDGGKTFQTIISLLTDNGGTANGQIFIPYFEDGLGYHVYYKVLNTKEYGIPQNRERVFIVGFKDFREFYFPKPFTLELRLKDMLQDNPEYKYFLSDKQLNSIKKSKHEHSARIHNIDGCSPTIMAKSGGGHEPYIEMPIDDKYFLSESAIKSILINKNNIQKSTINPLIANALQCPGHSCGIYKGMNAIKVPSATKKGFEEAEDGDSINILFPNSKTRKGRVGKGVAQTLDTGCNQAVVNQYKIRRLTPLECFRLQGFPDEAFFRAEKVNSDTQLYKQAGNSITTCVMVELFKKILL
jgi:DNA (cytosine-5)-methyltransferase 1